MDGASAMPDPVALASALIRCPSVTPADAGALDVLQRALQGLGFRCHRLPFSAAGTPDVDNLYAVIGEGRPNFCFAGHTDVVPPGAPADWAVDPFAGAVRDGLLHGRGAADMKAAIAAFVAAAAGFLAESGTRWHGSISLLITGDEEGPAVNGTAKVLRWLADRGEALDACVVGEPTNPGQLGEMIKIGRRGSLNATITVTGVQGHSAYPHLADNPIHHLVRMLAALTAAPLDSGSAHFQPSTLQITSVDVGNPATNVIPAKATARLNVRFNDLHSGAAVADWIRARCREAAPEASHEVDVSISGESFLTPPGPLTDLAVAAIEAELGTTPQLSTTGGTSDARFIKDFCPVIEFGMVGQTMHKVDERVEVADVAALTRIYRRMLDRFFAQR
ncbi:MAG: succinyl-diaminopimelate desuccinylase [Alphaproteobacteria bacterium]